MGPVRDCGFAAPRPAPMTVFLARKARGRPRLHRGQVPLPEPPGFGAWAASRGRAAAPLTDKLSTPLTRPPPVTGSGARHLSPVPARRHSWPSLRQR